MAVTITSTSTKRSWADIVKGPTAQILLEPQLTGTPMAPELQSTPPMDAPEESALRPGKRGERRCYCQGEVLVMLGHYGWIMTFDEIDHPDVDKTAGRVYVHKRDVAKGASLAQGDTVSFYLYADDQGLGAEHCQLQRHASSDTNEEEEFVPADDGVCQQEKVSILRADAHDFIPGGACPAPGWNVCAAEFVPAATTISSCFNAQATEFVPSESSAVEAHVQDIGQALKFSSIAASNPHSLSINPAFLSDDESDDESGIVSSDDFSGIDGDKESDDSDEESGGSDKSSICGESIQSLHHDSDVEWSSDLDAVVLHAPLKSPRASSVDDSTSAGATDSEAEDAMRFAVKAPPGLSLPKGWRPPPGLALPVLAQ